MWEKSKNFLMRTLLMSFVLCLLCFSSSVVGAYTPQTEQQATITMSTDQYNRLKRIIAQQDSRLEQLNQKLNLLKSNSTEVSSELTAVQSELTSQKVELLKTKKSLTIASNSLAQAEETLKKQKIYLDQLTSEIKSLEHKQKVLRRQRDVWAAVCGVAIGGWLANR